MLRKPPIRLAVLGFFLSAAAGQSSSHWFEQVKWIATDQEKKQWKKLHTQEERDRFVVDFWERRDPDPATAENEYQINYQERLDLVERVFNTGSPSWSTDRGRLFLLHGVPTEVHSRDDRQVWIYRLATDGPAGDSFAVELTCRDPNRDSSFPFFNAPPGSVNQDPDQTGLRTVKRYVTEIYARSPIQDNCRISNAGEVDRYLNVNTGGLRRDAFQRFSVNRALIRQILAPPPLPRDDTRPDNGAATTF